MNNTKRALTALASAAILAPALVSCASNEQVVRYQSDLGVALNVKCDSGLVAFTPDNTEAPQGFYTPENLGKEAVRVATKDNNPYAPMAGAFAMGAAEQALKEACGKDVTYTEPNDDGIVAIAPPEAYVVARDHVATYQNGLEIDVKDVFSYSWIKAGNQFSDRVTAGEGNKLIVVDLNVANAGSSPVKVGSSYQLQDKDGRRFNPLGFDLNASMWVDETRSSDVQSYESINPGSKATETLIFRVPSDATGLELADRNEYVWTF